MANTGTDTHVTSRTELFGSVEGGDFLSVVIVTFVIATADLSWILSSERLAHWFLVPISICGILVGIDAVDWLRGRIDLYDPLGIIGLLGVHYFYLAPLLHVYWDAWVVSSAPPPDWRDWLGYMGILNAVGLILYRACRATFCRRGRYRGSLWSIDKVKFRIVLPIAVFISAAAQTLVYVRYGGVTGYMDARINDPTSFSGMGWLFMISESAPILITFFVITHLQQQHVKWSAAALAFVFLFGLQMYFGGLRGSRSETIQLFFWAVGCVHFLVRPVPRGLVYVGCAVFMGFLYLYGFYKSMGKEAGEAITASAEDRDYFSQKKHKTFKGLILGDLARADIQAFILFRLCHDIEDFDYAKGRTYLGALAIWIPHWILPDRPDTKLKEGTEIQDGSGYDPNYTSSHVYGMAAEAMLNFGPISAALCYGLFGLFIGWFRRAVARFLPGDARFLLVPLAVYMCLGVVLGDSDNMTFGIAKNGFVPFLVLAICTTKHKVCGTGVTRLQALAHHGVAPANDTCIHCRSAWANQ